MRAGTTIWRPMAYNLGSSGQHSTRQAHPRSCLISEADLLSSYSTHGLTPRILRAARSPASSPSSQFGRKFSYTEEAVSDWLAALQKECHANTSKKIFEIGGFWLDHGAGSPSWYAFHYDTDSGRVRRESLGLNDLEEAKLAISRKL